MPATTPRSQPQKAGGTGIRKASAPPARRPPLHGPPPTGLDTRTRIRVTAARLFARRGYAGTGLKHIAADASAPFGSIYHFFPGGKDELAEDMIRTSGPEFLAYVLAILNEIDDPQESVRHAFDVAAAMLVATDYADGCPIATMALDVASTNERLRGAAAEVFDEWITAATAWFESRGVRSEQARDVAHAFIMQVEGAFLLARTMRDPEPVHAAGRAMASLVGAALGSQGVGRRRRT